MAYVGHRLLEDISPNVMFDLLEQRMAQWEKQEDESQPPDWMTWHELVDKHPWCADPLLPNCQELRVGKSCVAGRGLRGTAQALCRLYSEATVVEALESSGTNSSKLEVKSLEEWEELGCCLEYGLASQILKFKRLDGGGIVTGYGQLDGATSSFVVRLPGISIAALLTLADKDARYAGREILSVVAAQLGLEPIWPHEVPAVPAQYSPTLEAAKPAEAEAQELRQQLSRLEAQMAQLLAAIPSSQGAGAGATAAARIELAGSWRSTESVGLEEVLETLGIPAMVRSLARRLTRALCIDVRPEGGSIKSIMSLAGRTVEESSMEFCIGQPFEGQHKHGSFEGLARWAAGISSGEHAEEANSPLRGLVVEKRFEVKEQAITLEEHFLPIAQGRMSVRTVIRGIGYVDVSVQTRADLTLLCASIDPKSLRLKKEVVLGGAQVWRSGKVASGAQSLAELAAMSVPGTVMLHYSDVESTTIFDRDGGDPGPSGPPLQVVPPAVAAVPSSPRRPSHTAPSSSTCRRSTGQGEMVSCASAARWTARGFASAFHALGHALEAGCGEDRERLPKALGAQAGTLATTPVPAAPAG